MTIETKSTLIDSVIEIYSNIFLDNRGSFLNAFRKENSAFQEIWGEREIRQVNLSETRETGAIRGMHFQKGIHSEAKIVRCLSGAIWDVAVDLRPKSKTFCKWHAVKLTPENGKALLIPEGCAHGFQVLETNSKLLYLHSGNWIKAADSGVRWNDPKLGISWPLTVSQLNERDKNFPFL